MIEAYLKAPWTTALDDVPYQELGEAWTVNSEAGSICTVDCPKAYAENVAHLIAAAPDLYEALAEYVACVAIAADPAMGQADVFTLAETQQRMLAARDAAVAALARARGETS